MQQRDDCQTRLLFNLETSKIGSKNIGCLIFELAKTTKTKAREVAVMLEHLWNFFLQGGFQLLLHIFSTKMKNLVQPTRSTFEEKNSQ